MELVLTDHPMDCKNCEVDQNCELQAVANDLGINDHRYNNPKQHKGIPKDTSHSYMRMNLNNCINCGRCVRACDEIQGSFVLTMSGRGFESRITTDNDMLFGDLPLVYPVVPVPTHVQQMLYQMYLHQNLRTLIKRLELHVHIVVLVVILKHQ